MSRLPRHLAVLLAVFALALTACTPADDFAGGDDDEETAAPAEEGAGDDAAVDADEPLPPPEEELIQIAREGANLPADMSDEEVVAVMDEACEIIEDDGDLVAYSREWSDDLVDAFVFYATLAAERCPDYDGSEEWETVLDAAIEEAEAEEGAGDEPTDEPADEG